MINWWLWAGTAALYALFRAWYGNRRGKLTPAEIDFYLDRGRQHGADAVNDLSIIRQFLEQDDGREFFMVNLVKTTGQIPHPETGAPTTGQAMLQHYSKTFVKNMIRYAGHPALATRKIGGYVDAWNVPPDPGWQITGFMRYRSRRDMIDMATDPQFNAIHKFKIAGVAETFSFPSQPMIMLLAGPRVTVALILLLAAAFIQIALLLHR